jgi:hypothetical protein
MEQRALSTVVRYIMNRPTSIHAGERNMKTLLSAVAALAVIGAAGAAMAADAPASDMPPPAKHHHHRHAPAAETPAATDDKPMHHHHEHAMPASAERTEHGGPPSTPAERAETEKLNDQQLGH